MHGLMASAGKDNSMYFGGGWREMENCMVPKTLVEGRGSPINSILLSEF